MKDNELKRSSSTKYQTTFETFLRHYRRTHQLDENWMPQSENDWEHFCRWLIDACTDQQYSKNYSMLAKSAVIFMATKLGGTGAQKGIDIINHWRLQETQPTDSRAQRKSRPSARMIPKEDLSAIIDYFNRHRSKGNMRAQAMLLASVGCGARPVEWVRAQLVADNIIRIYNAKVKNINAWNKVRPGIFTEYELEPDVDIHEFAGESDDLLAHPDYIIFEDRIHRSGLDKELDADLIEELHQKRRGADQDIFRDVIFEPEFKIPIKINLMNIDGFFRKKFGDNWMDMDKEALEHTFQKDFYNGVRLALWRACQNLFSDGRIYSPADGRSTFAANRKAKAGLAVASKDLGHHGIRTTIKHYAGARKAWK